MLNNKPTKHITDRELEDIHYKIRLHNNHNIGVKLTSTEVRVLNKLIKELIKYRNLSRLMDL